MHSECHFWPSLDRNTKNKKMTQMAVISLLCKKLLLNFQFFNKMKINIKLVKLNFYEMYVLLNHYLVINNIIKTF